MKGQIGYIALLFTFTFVFSNIVFPQDADKMMKLRLAQNFEEADEWERAVALYEELYTSEPTNFIFLDGLRRSYTQLKEYDNAIGIIRRWFITHPRDINLMTTLGGLYYDSGNETAADSVWKVVLSIDPNNVQSYRIVANEMMQHRLYEQCIRTYIDGRTMSKSDVVFADELGTLYAALQQYTSATQEYIRLVKKNPDQLSFVQSRLSTIILKPEALRAASEIVKAEVKISPDNIALLRLYVWLLMEERRYDSALEHYRIIDRLANANGSELFNFAQQLNQEHASAAAAEAFKEIIDRFDKSGLLPYARFGYARALEELSDEADTLAPESQPTYREVIQIYESIAAAQDHPDLAVQSLFRIGVIKFEKLFDLDGALSAFNKIKEFPNTMNILYDAAIKNGEVQIARNDLVGARKEFERIAELPLVIYQDQAIFKLVELNYFEAHFDTSLSLLKRFDTNLNADLTNDALQLQYFIQENKTSSLPALIEFAKADLQMRQRKYPESLSRFRYIVKQYPTTLLLDDAMMKIGELHLKLKQTNEAIAAFRFIADSIELSILKDRAQFRIAEIFENILHNKAQAITAYEKLLERFPNSLYAEQARKRIRLLRGDGV
ncbi:MAG: tetratricopeptide repeat protein [Bacteroidota bacterium]|jgi:tetratricopeptide (TPR) repeat protein